MIQMSKMDYRSALEFVSRKLAHKVVNTNDPLDLLLFILQVSKEEFYATPGTKELTDHELVELDSAIVEYLTDKPIELITGSTEFYGCQIRLVPGVLIPRIETEGLVDRLVKDLMSLKFVKKLKILEVGTGSGCIISAIAKTLVDVGINDFELLGVDPSETAFEVTIKNIELNTEFSFDLQDKVATAQSGENHITIVNCTIKELSKYNLQENTPDIIISNPPYITTNEMQSLPNSVKKFEPTVALDGGIDGLNVFEDILAITQINGIDKLPKLYFEASPSTINRLAELVKTNNYPEDQIEILEDVFARKRYLITK